ncbi:MAG: hypothetical protein V3T05_01610 [Myxococcota bacterium]
MTMTRRGFLRRSLAVSGTGVALGLLTARCGGDDDGSQSGGNCSGNGTTVAIGLNHGHALVVTKGDVSAGVDKTYDIQATATHAHDVTITAADFAKLAGNEGIEVTSTSTPGHSHTIVVNCA